MNYMSLIYFTAYNQDSVAQPGNTKFNAFLGFTDKDSHWNASLFIRNITDKRTIANALVGSATPGFAVNGSLAPPRTFGIRVGYGFRSEEHTSELQSLMRISYAVFCLKKQPDPQTK